MVQSILRPFRYKDHFSPRQKLIVELFLVPPVTGKTDSILRSLFICTEDGLTS